MAAIVRRWHSIVRWCRQNEWLSELCFIPVAVGLSWCLVAFKGVPLTHDGMGLVFIEAYRRAYRAGDFFPTWTSFGENGHGSSLLILYHRLHAQLAALLALGTGTVVALKVSIPFWLTIGGIGMRRYCRFHDVRPWVAWVCGVFLMSSNYVNANWYIRGATAEFVAFMLVPWGLRYASELFERRWGVVRMGVATALIFYAHMMTFYFFVLTAGLVIAVEFYRLRVCGWRRLRAAASRGLAFGALVTCLIGPAAAAVTYTNAFSPLAPFGMRSHPWDFAPFSVYFADPALSWSRKVFEGEMTLEIGRWILLCLGVFLLIEPRARRSVWQRVDVLVLVAAWYVALQHYGMTFWIELLPGAQKLQFPARLLVFIVTIAILAMGIATEAARRSDLPVVRMMACALPLFGLVWQCNQTCENQSAIGWLNVDRKVADAALADDNSILTHAVSMSQDWPVFLPTRHGNNSALQPFLKASDGCLFSSPALTHGARVAEVTKNVTGAVSFTVHGTNCTVKLNQIQSVLLRVQLSKPGAMRQTEDGLTLIEAPIDGTVVQIGERGWLDLARKFLVEKTGRFQ
jgi:hypothetical protein